MATRTAARTLRRVRWSGRSIFIAKQSTIKAPSSFRLVKPMTAQPTMALEVARFDEVHIDRLGTFRGPVSMSCVGEVITRVGVLHFLRMATRTAARTLRWLLELEGFYVFGANSPPIFVVVSHLDVPVDRRILPFGRAHAISMFCRIVMDVIEMILKIPYVPNTMLPEPSLPYASIPVFTL